MGVIRTWDKLKYFPGRHYGESVKSVLQSGFLKDSLLVAIYLLKTCKMTMWVKQIVLCCGSAGVYQATGRSIRGDKENLHSIMHHHLHFQAILGPGINSATFMVHLILNKRYSHPQIFGQMKGQWGLLPRSQTHLPDLFSSGKYVSLLYSDIPALQMYFPL